MAADPFTTEFLTVDPDAPAAAAIARAAKFLRAGRLVALPTETVYGLAANALDADAVGRIFLAKGRPTNNPVIVHVLDAAEARELCDGWTELADRLAAEFWPGPLTMVLPKLECIPSVVTGGGPTVALRAPSHPVARAILAAAQLPLAAPSANRSNHVSPTTAEHVASDLRGRIDLIVDAGPCRVGVESTVVDLSMECPRLLRPGGVGVDELRRVAPDLAMPETARPTPRSSFGSAAAPPAAMPSPGMLLRHYAPSAPLELVAAENAERRVLELARTQMVGWLHYETGDQPSTSLSERLFVQTLPDDAVRYAAQLYAALRGFEARGCECIVASIPPASEAWRTVRDRLTRAAATPE